MPNTKHLNIDQNRPFLGLKSYEEEHKKWFGGRIKEVEKLLTLIEDNLLTILFGKSGIGKTSLIKAGLLPKLRKNFYLPIYVRIDFEAKAVDPLQQLMSGIERQILAKDPKAMTIGEMTLWEYLHEVKILDGIMQPVLFLDQFEELFTLAGLKEPRIQSFLSALSDLAENRVPLSVQASRKKENKPIKSTYANAEYRVVLSFREDYLANMENLRPLMPSLRNSRFRIKEMNGQNALNAILTSAKSIISEDNAREIINMLPDNRLFKENQPEENDWQNKSIEPFMLSLVCYEINEHRIKKKLPEINIELIKKINVQSIIKDHYTNNVIKKYDKKVTVAIEELLVTSDGYRRFCIRNDFVEKFNVSNEQLDALINDRIIRQETRNGHDYVELIHDTMAPFIRNSRWARHDKEKKDLENVEMKKKAGRFRVVAAILLLGLIASLFFSYKARQAEEKAIKFAKEAKKDKQVAIVAEQTTKDLKQAVSDYSDSISTAIAFLEDSIAKINLMLKEANVREKQIVQQVSVSELRSYNYSSYKVALDIADSLKTKYDYVGAKQQYKIAYDYCDNNAAKQRIKVKLSNVERQLKTHQEWNIYVYYREVKRSATVSKAKRVTTLLKNQGFNVAIHSLSEKNNLRGGDNKTNLIMVDQNEKSGDAIVKNIISILGKYGYKFSVRPVEDKIKKGNLINIYIYS